MTKKQQELDIANALAAEIKKEITVGEGGKFTIDPESYVKRLPEGATVELVKAIQAQNSVYFPAATKAFGELSNDYLTKNPDISTTSISIPMVDRDALNIEMNRKRTFGETTKYGNVTVSHEMYAAKNSRGLMGTIRDELSKQALEAYGKD